MLQEQNNFPKTGEFVPNQTNDVSGLNSFNNVPVVGQFSSNLPPKNENKNSKSLFVIIVSILFIALVLGSVLAYQTFVVSSPQKIVTKAFSNLLQANSVSFSFNTEMIFELLSTKETVKNTFIGSAIGSIDLKNLFENPHFALDIDINGDILGKYLVGNNSIPINFEVSASIRMVDGKLYILPKSVPLVSALLKSILPEGTWIYGDLSLVTNQSFVEQDQINSLEKFIQKKTWDKIKKEIVKNNIFIPVGQMTEENLSGVNVYKITVSVDKEGLKKTIDDVVSVLKSDGIIDVSMENDLAKSVIDLKRDIDLQDVGNLSLWITKDGYLVKIGQDFKETKFGSTIAVSSFIEFSKYNQPISFEAPSPVISFEELMNKALPLLMKGVKSFSF